MANDLALHFAAEKNNLPEVKRLLSLGADVNMINQNYFTPLHEAARANKKNSHFKCIKKLLKNGADVIAKTDTGSTPLRYLVEKGGVKTVDLLLKSGADVNIYDNEYQTPLNIAIQSDNFEAAKLLVEYGSNVKSISSSIWGPMMIAVSQNSGESNFKICELLLKNGADANEKVIHGNTAFHHLVGEANIKIVQLFLDYKADVNIKNDHGEIPLFSAVKCNNHVVVQLLLNLGSDITIFNSDDGSSLLHVACMYGCKVKILKILLKKGVDVNALDCEGHTPLMILDFVITNPYQAPLLLLLKYTDVNIVDLDGHNVLDFYLKKWKKKIILEHIAKMQALDFSLHPSILESISKNVVLRRYFEECKEELAKAKGTKLKNCWVTFFDLLVDGRRKLKNYAGNKDLIQDFKRTNRRFKFPIYGASMEKNFTKGLRIRKYFDDSAEILSDRIPIFNPTHLIIRDILDHLETKDLLKLCVND